MGLCQYWLVLGSFFVLVTQSYADDAPAYLRCPASDDPPTVRATSQALEVLQSAEALDVVKPLVTQLIKDSIDLAGHELRVLGQ